MKPTGGASTSHRMAASPCAPKYSQAEGREELFERPLAGGTRLIVLRGSVKQIFKISLIAVMPLLIVTARRQGNESTPAVSAQASLPATNEDVGEMLSKLEQDWTEATVKGDVAFQDSILADDYIGIMDDGSTNTEVQ